MAVDRQGLPPLVAAEDVARPNRSLITNGLDEGAFVEFRDGASAKNQMVKLIVVTKSAPATAKGRWLEAILLGCDNSEWRAWNDNHGPADASQGDATCIFHELAEEVQRSLRAAGQARGAHDAVPSAHLCPGRAVGVCTRGGGGVTLALVRFKL